jgi:hypothetical protein
MEPLWVDGFVCVSTPPPPLILSTVGVWLFRMRDLFFTLLWIPAI